MQTMQHSSPGANGMTYANVPTCYDVTVPWWYAYVVSSLDTRTGPWTESASQTACRVRGKSLPNCSNSGTAPVGGFTDARSVGVRISRQVEDQARTAMCLRHRRNAGELQLLLEKIYCVCPWEEDAEAILNPPLYLPPDEGIHLRDARRCMWTLGYGGLQRLGMPRGPSVCEDSLLYIGPKQVHRQMFRPL